MTGVRGVFSRIVAASVSIARSKRLAAEVIAKSAVPLRSGAWKVGRHFSRHDSVAQLPPPLNLVKQWGHWRRGERLKASMRLLEAAIPPWRSMRTTAGDPQYEADVLLINRLGQPVGFDLQRGSVVRTCSREEAEQLERKRLELAPIYDCVSFEAHDTAPYIIEPFVRGVSFGVAPVEEREAAVRGFLDGLMSAPAQVLPAADAQEWRMSTAEILPRFQLTESVCSAISDSAARLVSEARCSWVHGDLHGDNIVMRSGSPVVIDYQTAEVAPSFTDIMTLFVFEARSQRPRFLTALARGEYDAALRALGCDIREPHDRLAIFVSWLGWKATRERFSRINVERFVGLAKEHILDAESR